MMHDGPASTAQLAQSSIIDGVRLVTHRRLLGDLLGETFCRALRDAAVQLGSTSVMLIDGELSVDDDGVSELISSYRQRGDAVVVVFCSPAPLVAAAWVETGASAVLTHECSAVELLDVVDRLSKGESVLGVAVREGLLSQLRLHRVAQAERDQVFHSLTKREREVLALLAFGSSPEDIARSSFVSMNTVRTQIRNVLTKLSVASVAAAVAMAHCSRWFDDRIA